MNEAMTLNTIKTVCSESIGYAEDQMVKGSIAMLFQRRKEVRGPVHHTHINQKPFVDYNITGRGGLLLAFG
jgi:hypothetical protein